MTFPEARPIYYLGNSIPHLVRLSGLRRMMFQKRW